MTQHIQNTVNLADVEAIDISGKLWNDVHANTYHSVQVAVLLKGDDKYTDLGFNSYAYGYERQYEDTALKIIRETVTGWNPTEKALHWIEKELQIKIQSRSEYVKRKRDL